MNVPSNFRSSVALRDYVLNVAENGVSDDQAATHTDDLITKLTAAQLETITIVTSLVARVNALEQQRQ